MMKKFLFFLFFIFPITLFANPITNVRAMQEGKNIVILYDLNEDAYVNQITMVIDGQSRVIPNKCLKGDIDKDLTSGVNKRIEYDVLADYKDGFENDNVVFVIEQGGFYAVDLGLSVKWASCNVGADTPEEYGDYFTNKDIFTLINKLNEKNIWKIPTHKDITELLDRCMWIWSTSKGVYGYKVIGPNKNYIFLPAAGFVPYNTDIHFDVGKSGKYLFYWGSNNKLDYMHYVFFDINNIYRSGSYGQVAISVRLIYI